MSLGDIIGIGGSILGGLFGKKSGSDAAENIRAGSREASQLIQPFIDPGVKANQAVFDALGQGAPGAQQEQFENFLSSTGFQARLKAGSQAITGNRASVGLLNSGSTLKRLEEFGQNEAQGQFSNFLSLLGGVAGRGLTAAGGAANALIGANVPAAQAELGGQSALQSGIGAAFGGIGRLFGANTPSPQTPGVVGGLGSITAPFNDPSFSNLFPGE